MHWRAKGGDQERKLAEKFQIFSQQIRSKWARTASILNRVVAKYEQEGKEYDEKDALEEFE